MENDKWKIMVVSLRRTQDLCWLLNSVGATNAARGAPFGGTPLQIVLQFLLISNKLLGGIDLVNIR